MNPFSRIQPAIFIGTFAVDYAMYKKIKKYIKNGDKPAAVKYVADKVKSNHKFELEVRNTLKLKHDNTLTYYHFELFVNEVIRLKYTEYK